MKTLWIDAGNGAAGDMLLAALLDAGADARSVRDGLSGLAVEPITIETRPVRRHGLRATQVQVETHDSTVHRRLADIRSILAAATLPTKAARFAQEVFERLAAAEARVHGVAVDDVRFHEVGALDAIADVVGCALALHDLGLLERCVRVVGPVAVGSGTVTAAHGRLPVPVPAVLELLSNARATLAGHPARMELCTPTGAALLASIATGWGPPPPATLRAVGVGAGTSDPQSHPNVLRVLLGDAADTPVRQITTALRRIDTTVDDLDPRMWPDVLDSLRAAGALDAWCTPILTHKGRPGQLMSVLARPDDVDVLCQVVFEHTTTLGVRISEVERRSLARDQVEVTAGDAVVRVKRGFLGPTPITINPEYDDVVAAARRTGVPVRAVMDDVRQKAYAREVAKDTDDAADSP